jgi:hypothetical protein
MNAKFDEVYRHFDASDKRFDLLEIPDPLRPALE